MDEMIPTIISQKYEVLGQIGRGGMGIVYQARHLTLDTFLALKVLPPDLAQDLDLVARFHREARVMARLNHPHIVRVLDIDRHEGLHYFVMEYVRGKSLGQYLRDRGPLPLADTLGIAHQVARALEYAHSHELSVIHRDIKPSNILIEDPTGRAVVTDFGIAKLKGGDDQTRTGFVVGTIKYCAPEQIRKDSHLDGRVDVYSLGLVMYEMVVGRSFFEGLDEQTIIGKVLYEPGENLPSFPYPPPPDFTTIVTRAIAKDREHRYPTAATLRADIEACLVRHRKEEVTSPTPLFTEAPTIPVSPPKTEGTFFPEVKEQRGTTLPPGSEEKKRWWSWMLHPQLRVALSLSVAFAAILSLFLLRGPRIPPQEGREEVRSESLNQPPPVERGGIRPPAPEPRPSLLSQEKRQPKAIGVMHFKALSADPQQEWMREAIRDNFNSQLSSAPVLKVYAKEYIDFLAQKGPYTEIEVASQLGIAKMVSGSFLATANKLRIEVHIVDVQTGLLEVSDYVEGEQSDFFDLQRQLALKIMGRLNVAVSPEEKGVVPSAPPASSLDAYKLLLEAEGETSAAGPPEGDDLHSRGSPRREGDKLSRGPLRWGWPGASVAWAEEDSQQELAPEEEIRQVLERYRQAYEKKDLALLDDVYDRLTAAQREANAKYFQNTQNLHVTIRDVDIAIRGNEAAVSYTREDQFIDAETRQDVRLEVRLTKIFMLMDGTWKIASRGK